MLVSITFSISTISRVLMLVFLTTYIVGMDAGRYIYKIIQKAKSKQLNNKHLKQYEYSGSK